MNRKWLNFCCDTVFLITAAVIITLLIWLFSACSPRVITVPEYHMQYIVRTDTFIRHDSIYKNDSVIIRVVNDTVFIERWRTEYKDRLRDRVVHDTIAKTDSIRVPYPIEKQLTRWESLKLKAGGYVFAVLIVEALWLIIMWMKNHGVIFRRPRDGL